MMQAHQSNNSWLMYMLQSQIVDNASPPVAFQCLQSLTSIQVNGDNITAHDLLQCYKKRASVSDGMPWGEDLTRLSPCSDKYDSSAVELTFSRDFLLHNSNTKQPRALRRTDTELQDKCCPVPHLTQIHCLSFIKSCLSFHFRSWSTLGKILGRPVITKATAPPQSSQTIFRKNPPSNTVYLFKIWEQN